LRPSGYREQLMQCHIALFRHHPRRRSWLEIIARFIELVARSVRCVKSIMHLYMSHLRSHRP
jgi:hypothetical protein